MYTDLNICATFVRFWWRNVNTCQRQSPSASPAIKDPEYFQGVSRRTANQACCCDLPRPPHVLAFALRVFGVVVIQPSFLFRGGNQLGAAASSIRLCFVLFFFLAPRPECRCWMLMTRKWKFCAVQQVTGFLAIPILIIMSLSSWVAKSSCSSVLPTLRQKVLQPPPFTSTSRWVE